MESFLDLRINTKIIEALNELEISKPTPIQEQAIPLLLDGKDVIGQAQTGTGKTFAYGIPLLERLNPLEKVTQALVLCPTRELSLQVGNEMLKLAKYLKVSFATIYGGVSYEKQFSELKKKPLVIIGTPGRIIDHIRRKTLNLKSVNYLVIDEADEMLKMGFEEDMKTILEELPTDRQSALFSATIPPFVKTVSKNYMLNPQFVKIENKTLTVEKIDELLYYVRKEQKKDLLLRILDYNCFNSCIIFANTKAMVDELVEFLQVRKYQAEGLHGDLKQANRDKVMQAFRLGTMTILIATDVAARGLDVEGVEAIINYDLPQEKEIYVHRIGRTGRAGKTGTAITFATPRESRTINDLEKLTKTKLKVMPIPTAKEIEKKVQKHLYEQIVNYLDEAKDNHNYDNLIRAISKVTSDPMPIIVRLLEIIIGKDKKQYKEIETIHNVYKKNSKETKNVVITIGRKDKVTPQALLHYLNKKVLIHTNNVGVINIDKDETTFELKKVALKHLKNIHKEPFLGKKISYKVIE